MFFSCSGIDKLQIEFSNLVIIVEMYIPYPVGTELQMALEVADSKIVADGIVRVVYPGLGIGIEFTDMTDENRVRLNELIAPVRQGFL